jgi:3-oxoacyl-[acyl-carrier protein] reductase
MFSLHEKHALVTGASGDIGRAICESFLAAGINNLCITGRDEAILQKLEREFSAKFAHVKFHIIVCDASSEANNRKMIQTAHAKMNGIDILVCNAGITEDKSLKNLSVASWHNVMNINLHAPFYQVQEALNMSAVVDMQGAHKVSRIVLLTSVVGQTGSFGQANYCAAKSGLTGFCKSVALEYATKHITVNCIAPGYMRGKMTGSIPSNVKGTIEQKIPMKHFGEPNAIGAAAVYLASDEAAYMTGQTLHINGGLSMQ